MAGSLRALALLSTLASAGACLWLCAGTPKRPVAGAPAQAQGRDVPGIRTDRRIYRKPALPALPAAGGTYRDPVFGTEVMRVTDASECPAPGCGTYYSHWPTFNSDETRMLIRKGETGNALVKGFDPVNFKAGPSRQLPTEYPHNFTLSWESAIWSHTDPHLIYVFSNDFRGSMRLYVYDVGRDSFKLVKDFSALAGGRDVLHQMNMSADDDVFSWSILREGRNGVPLAYLVWRRSDDRVLAHTPNTMDFNEVHVDKTGHYLNVPLNQHLPDGTAMQFVDLRTGKVTGIVDGAPDYRPGHGDLGTDSIVGFDNDLDGITWRRMSDPHSPRHVFYFRTGVGREGGVADWTQDFHATMLADDESWLTVGTYDDPAINLPDSGIYEDEIFQVALDGSERIRRLLHTRCAIDNQSPTTGYTAMPKPTISRDGRFIAYTSNWEKSGRYDLFIARIDPAPKLTLPPAAPTPEAKRPRRVARGR